MPALKCLNPFQPLSPHMPHEAGHTTLAQSSAPPTAMQLPPLAGSVSSLETIPWTQPAPTNPSWPSEKTSVPCKPTHRATATTLCPAYHAAPPHPYPPNPTHRQPMDPSTSLHHYLLALPNPTIASLTQTTLYPNHTKGPCPITISAPVAASSLPLPITTPPTFAQSTPSSLRPLTP